MDSRIISMLNQIGVSAEAIARRANSTRLSPAQNRPTRAPAEDKKLNVTVLASRSARKQPRPALTV